jgi:hypothetical protein
MSMNDTRTLHKKKQTEISGGPQESGEPSPLLEQAQAWANIAREAHDACAKGDQAEHLLHLRRNSSGQ